MQETQVWSLARQDPLEKKMETQSSVLAWRIPWSEEPSRLLSTGCKELDTTEWLPHMGDDEGQGSLVTKSWTWLSDWTTRTQYDYFLSVQYRIVNYRFCAVQQISRTYSFCVTETKPTGQQLLIVPSLQSPAIAILLFFYMTVLDTSYK